MLSNHIKQFAAQFPIMREHAYRYNESSNLLVNDVAEDLYESLELDDKVYSIKGSVGTGNWADIPWFAIMHRGVTSSTQNGYYVTGLFTHDMSKLFITLGLGWTQFAEKYGNKHGREMVVNYTNKLGGYLAVKSTYSGGPIELGAGTSQSKGYEISNVLSVPLHIETLTDETLVPVLRDFLSYYGEIRDRYGADLFYGEAPDLAPDSLEEDAIRTVRQLSLEVDKSKALLKLESIADTLPPGKRKRYVSQIIRNSSFAAYVKSRASYMCEICGKEPFIKKNGQPYAEADHIDPLYALGKDHPDNMRCVCAQCHRVVTYGNASEIEKLKIDSKKVYRLKS